MSLLADLHIAPRTVEFLRALGHDVIRVKEVLPATADDNAVIELAARETRTILTQDLDFSAIIALSGKSAPSLISLRLSSSRIDHVNAILQKILRDIEADALLGSIIAVEDSRVRCRPLPVVA
jgi:predicted nuclease of predicted toxin-antitoxin system